MRVLSRPRFASVCAMLALVVALGGTSYAATALPRDSVGTLQLRTGAVTTTDIAGNAVIGSRVKNGSLTASDLAAGTIPTRPIVGDLPSGRTLQGYGEILAEVPVAGGLASVSISFAHPLPADIGADQVHVVRVGETAPNGCSGTAGDPGAARGHLCVFELGGGRNSGPPQVNGPAGDGTTSRFGFSFWQRSPAAGLTVALVSWAVTAP